MRRRTWALAAPGILLTLGAVAAALVAFRGNEAVSATQEPPASTGKVERGKLSAMVSLNGTLTYRARSDGAPYSAINQADGTYTELPDVGDRVDCGSAFYRIDEDPVLLLCGRVPAYRDLKEGDKGRDVGELNHNLHELGYDAGAGTDIDPGSREFTWETAAALEALQQDSGLEETGSLDLGAAVFQPESLRVAKVVAQLGGSASPGSEVAQATAGTLQVQAGLGPAQQEAVEAGDRARITLPGNRSVSGTVERLGSVAQAPAGQKGSSPGEATIPVYIGLDKPKQASGLDRAPVQVEIRTEGVKRALSVPVTAIVGKPGGGLAVEVVRDGDQRELVAVKPGLFDTTAGRVQVEGDIAAGERVVVPSQ